MELPNIKKLKGTIYRKVERQYGAYREINFPDGITEEQKDTIRNLEEEKLKSDFGRAIAEKARIIHKKRMPPDPKDPLQFVLSCDETVGIKLTIVELEEVDDEPDENG